MTVIVWDGTTLAADKQATNSGLRRTTTKIRRVTLDGRPYLLAGEGQEYQIRAVIAWFEAGAKPCDFPKENTDTEVFANVWVVMPDGSHGHYENSPVWLPGEDGKFAAGVGQECATGALAAGARAIKAVMICNDHISGCGKGVDWLRLDGTSGQCLS